MLAAAVPKVRKGRKLILQAMQIEAAAGEVIGVVGPNGAGKSTLLRSLAGVDATAAQSRWRSARLMPAQIGYMPQAFHAPARLSVLECVLLGRRERLGWRVSRLDLSASTEALARLGMEALAERSLESLSGGQQQMVFLAQRLVRQPTLMILDEPTSALDLRHQLAILEQLRAYAREHSAVVIMALHDLALAARYCDRLALMHDGHLVAMGPPPAILTAQKISRCWGIAPEILHSREGIPVIVPHRICPEA